MVLVAAGTFAVTRFVLPRFFPPRDDAAMPGGELVGRRLASLAAATDWLNSEPLTPDSLRGHPVIVALWSDTDPECLRSLPVLESWHQAYAGYGVRVIGVHEPDFAFAADSTVPARLARRLGLGFPIALDAASALPSELGGPVDGPRVLLADPTGTIVSAAVGRGILPGIERALRAELRRERGAQAFPADPEADTTGARAAAVGRPGPMTAGLPATHAVFLGTGRIAQGPLADAVPGTAQPFTAQFRFQVEGQPYVPYPVGLWSPGAEGPTAARGGAENFIALRYDAGALWAVLSPPRGGTVRVWVLRDEKWLGRDALGADARLDGRGASFVVVDEPRAYAVCRASRGHHVVKLSPEGQGLTVHALIVEPSPPGAEPP